MCIRDRTLSGARLDPDEAGRIVDEFLSEDFEGGRHERRVGEITTVERAAAERATS